MAATMEAAMFIMFNMHACVCMCVHVRACVHMRGGCDKTHPTPLHPPTHPQGGTPPNWVKTFDKTWTNQDISIPFEDLESVENSPPMGGCFGLVGGWVG